ncbi:MAG: hypothetical protein RR630_04595 [Coprobacillus sp.]
MKKCLLVLFCFVLMISLVGQLSFNEVKAIDTTKIVSAGTNDNVLNQIITDTLANTSDADTWQKFLDSEFGNRWSSFVWAKTDGNVPKWTGNMADGTGIANPKENCLALPVKNSAGVYEIYFPEQLAYALENSHLILGDHIVLMNDMDMVGYNHDWKYDPRLIDFTFDGNEHTIYNIGSKKSFIPSMKGKSVLKDVNFESAKLVSKEQLLGIVGNFSPNDGKENEVRNVGIKNSMFFSSFPTYDSSTHSYVAPLCESKNLIADNVSSINNTVYALKAHAGGAFAVTSNSAISNSYSVNTTVIAGGNHSGGFISCSNGGNVVKNSFTNNIVFGNEETGVFIGALMDNNSGPKYGDSFTNCYSSGSIEGQNELGGFVGHIDKKSYNSPIYTFTNCYSTSIVGMKKGGENLGGFVGLVETKTTFTDCYSAGEVGGIDTDTTNSTTHGNPTVGGFIGSFGAVNVTFKNSYYDKQTSAMREWESGKTRDYLEVNDEVLNSQGLNNILGLKGVLTSDSKKFGNGLASQPKTGVAISDFDKVTGFTGFTDDALVSSGSSIVKNPNWIYDGGNLNSTLHNCMYPQLKIFFENNNPLIRAFSYASVATVHEQVWDKCTHDQELPLATYDTIRDLTSRFTLTSYVDNPKDTGTLDIDWKKNDVKTGIYGVQKSVIGLLDKVQNSKYNREYWTADRFAPGIEWVKAEFKITQDGKEYVGSRRLRIIPTSNITPGSDQIDLSVGDTYNHAKDMYMAYSTAQRMSEVVPDITTGVYPDSQAFEDSRVNIQEKTNDIENQFALDTNKFLVGAEHMTKAVREVDTTHPDNIVSTYVYEVKAFEEVPGSDIAKIAYGTKADAIVSPAVLKGTDAERKSKAEAWIKKLTGQSEFKKEDKGRYLIEYEWVLPDGRFMRDSKMIMVQNGTHNVTAEVRNTNNDTLNNGSLKLNIDSYEYSDSTMPSPKFSEETVSSAKTEVKHGVPANIAFESINEKTTIDKIKFEFKLSDISSSNSTQEVIIKNVVVDKPFDVEISYYYSSFEENGNYYAKKVSTTKQYTLKKDATKGYYYLSLNQKFNDAHTGLDRRDVECDVKATIYVTDTKAVNTGKVTVQTKTFENDSVVSLSDKFKYQITGANGFEKIIEVSSEKDAIENLKLSVGNYTITQLTDNGYPLKEVTVDGKKVVKPFHFTVTTDDTVNIVFTNKKATQYGTVEISNETFKNDKRVYTEDPFEYQIFNSNGKVIKEFTLTSELNQHIRFELPIGTYTIVQKPLGGYTLQNMNINGNISNSAPFSFTIQKDGEVKVVAKNIVNVSIDGPAEPDKPIDPSNPNTGSDVDTSDDNSVNILYLYLGLSGSIVVILLYLKKRIFSKNK